MGKSWEEAGNGAVFRNAISPMAAEGLRAGSAGYFTMLSAFMCRFLSVLP